MEKIFNEISGITEEMTALLSRMEEGKESVSRLFRYYGSDEWFEDREGDLPEGIPAGVLSEDGVYDLLTLLREESFRMIENATDYLKRI
ncbi:MAG: DUF4298 domain-containing protein [Clostridia bacterium]|nr:DUF4298 domain-containing protein [Clostridia bacterium]